MIIELIRVYKPNFVLLQELKIGFKDANKIKIKGYTLITNLNTTDDYKATSVGILIKSGVIFTKIKTPTDLCVVGIDTFNKVPISIYSFYDNEIRKSLTERNLNRIISSGKNKSIIMGDFNTKCSMGS